MAEERLPFTIQIARSEEQLGKLSRCVTRPTRATFRRWRNC